MLANLALSTALVAATTAIHFAGLAFLMWWMQRSAARFSRHQDYLVAQFVLLLFAVMGLFGLHTAEIWLYAAVYYALGVLPDFESALYFSTSTFTTVGYGDVVIGPDWRLAAAIEGANGLVLIGWSTAFLVAVTARLRALETEWRARHGDDERAD